MKTCQSDGDRDDSTAILWRCGCDGGVAVFCMPEVYSFLSMPIVAKRITGCDLSWTAASDGRALSAMMQRYYVHVWMLDKNSETFMFDEQGLRRRCALVDDNRLTALCGLVCNNNVPCYRWRIMPENAIKYNNRDMDGTTGTADCCLWYVRPSSE